MSDWFPSKSKKEMEYIIQEKSRWYHVLMRVMDFENIATVKGTSKHASATNCRTSKMRNEGTVIFKTTRDKKKEIDRNLATDTQYNQT